MKAFMRYGLNLLIIGGLFAGAVYWLFPAPCSSPLKYSIGTVDPQFHVSKEDFLRTVQKAELVWEAQEGKNLFEYDQSSAFTINLVYDDRQAITDREKSFSSSLSKNVSQVQDTKEQYSAVYAEYKSAQSEYEQLKTVYEKDVKTFNARVSAYNASGGRDGSYDQLHNQQLALQKKADALEEKRTALNDLADQVNTLAQKNSQIVEVYNEAVKQFNQEFTQKREFDQGEYTGNAITIYEFAENNDLLLVLEHELGHALGMQHVENSSSIMYYQVNSKNVRTQALSLQDKEELISTCSQSPWNVFLSRLGVFYEQVINNS